MAGPVKGYMSGDDLRKWRVLWGARQCDIAELTGYTLSAVKKWEQGKRNIPPAVPRLLSQKSTLVELQALRGIINAPGARGFSGEVNIRRAVAGVRAAEIKIGRPKLTAVQKWERLNETDEQRAERKREAYARRDATRRANLAARGE